MKKDDYRTLSAVEEAADLCWKLCDVLGDHFVGFESLITELRNTAIHFEVEFSDYFKNA